MRSLLFVPGDSERKLDKALDSGADALIVDLEDSVAAEAKPRARELAAAFIRTRLATGRGPRLYVRINALDTGLTDEDLDAIVPARPAGLMLPKAESGADIARLDAKIAAVEALSQIEDGALTILPIATETARSLFQLGSLAGASPRLEGLTWGAEDLSADIGASANRDEAGNLTDLYRLARALCLAGAASAGVPAIDTVYTDFRDLDGLRRDCAAAVRDGFSAKLAIHPGQLATINEEFTPSTSVVAEAQAVIEAFHAAGESGVTSLHGRMLDRPHLKRAERVLARARAAGKA